MVSVHSDAATADAGVDAALATARWQIAEQLRTIESIDQKSDRAATLGVAVAVGLSGAATLIASKAGDTAIAAVLVTVAGATLALAAAGLCYIKSYQVRQWRIGPGSSDLSSNAANYPARNVKLWLIEEFASAIASNKALLSVKSSWARNLLAAVGTEAIIVSMGLAAASYLELVR